MYEWHCRIPKVSKFSGTWMCDWRLGKFDNQCWQMQKCWKPHFHASFLTGLVIIVKCGSDLSWQNLSGFHFTSEIQCFNSVVWLLLNCIENFGWNSLGLGLCESHLMKRHMDSALRSFQVPQPCGNCNPCYSQYSHLFSLSFTTWVLIRDFFFKFYFIF